MVLYHNIGAADSPRPNASVGMSYVFPGRVDTKSLITVEPVSSSSK